MHAAFLQYASKGAFEAHLASQKPLGRNHRRVSFSSSRIPSEIDTGNYLLLFFDPGLNIHFLQREEIY